METAFVGLIGVLVGAMIGPLVSHWTESMRSKEKWKRESFSRQLDGLYGPLYQKMCIMPEEDPEYYFSDWSTNDFMKWLRDALELIVPNVHLATDDLIQRLYHYREVASRDECDAEPATRELYRHIHETFFSLRRRLQIC